MGDQRRREQLEDICSRLAAHDYRITRQRRVIIGILLDAEGEHLTADQVYALVRQEYPEMGVATVYRTLDVLAGLGVVKRLDFGDGRNVYEISDDPHHHHHLVCLACGDVKEFGPDLLEDLEREITRREDFNITDHQVKFFGLCRLCRSRKSGG